MAEEVIDLLAPNMRGMLRILHMPDVKDGIGVDDGARSSRQRGGRTRNRARLDGTRTPLATAYLQINPSANKNFVAFMASCHGHECRVGAITL
jgi:hypothetical protein